MEISTLRNRLLVGTFATVMIVGSGVATALVASTDHPTTSEASDTSSSTSDTADTNPADSVSSTTPSTTGSTTGSTTATTLPSDSADDDSSSPARYSGPECGDGDTTNHGQYVSGQPKGGESRSAAAQSDCGKPLASVGDGDDADDGDDVGDAPDTDVHGPDDATPNPGSGHGNSANAPGHTK
jgi:hypothetical protein